MSETENPEEVAKMDATPPKNPTVSVGDSGLNQFSGYIREEFLPDLTGRRGAHTYREMRDNDAVIGAALSSMESLLRQVEWFVDPEDTDSTEDTTAAEILEEQWDQIDPPNFIAEALEFLVYGWALFETIYERKGNFLGWKEFAGRAQESLVRWEFEDDGTLVGMWQRKSSGTGEHLIPIDKCVHLRTTKRKNNPEGRSILRSAYRSWYFKKNIEQVEGIGVERDLAGMPVFYVPGQWTNPSDPNYSVYKDCQSKVTRIRRDEQEGLVLPSIYDANGNQTLKFELLASTGKRNFNTNEIIARFDSRIAMSMLSDFLMLGHDKVGSFALAEGKIDLFASGLGAWLDIIQAAVNLEAERLFLLNGITGRAWLRHGDVTPEDVSPLIKNLTEAIKAGAIIPDDGLEIWLREMLGAPAREENDEGSPFETEPEPDMTPDEEGDEEEGEDDGEDEDED
jgi:hypothetical protein